MSYSFRRFNPETDVLKPFDCGHADLNGFLLETAGNIPMESYFQKDPKFKKALFLSCTEDWSSRS